jgi:DNA-binding NarL/FixJ family response regulator
LSAHHHADAAALGALVKATASGGAPGGAVRVRNELGVATLAALVAPLPRRLSDAPGGPAGRVENQALILLRDLTAHPAAPATELLRDLFGLTRAEAEVARALAGGATKAAVAQARGIGETTVRTQVRALLTKTGAANLRDLERLLARVNGT